ncbi:hypothetical protein UG55_10035 [Frankia sp. EI5c]|uniref:RICIN domain-containing protein n=1 Tax=Frankia sp. EI5c TaxID=683316 RepID=UPI0007C21749|nr:RICIN domain-containing protein [Frankia sp. EI5c]OAA29194.1 hypothetical protein UG55_10035 [Frankia sp. EI5c]
MPALGRAAGLRRWQLTGLFVCTLLGASVVVGAAAAHGTKSYYSWQDPARLASRSTPSDAAGRQPVAPGTWPGGVDIAPLTPRPADSAAADAPAAGARPAGGVPATGGTRAAGGASSVGSAPAAGNTTAPRAALAPAAAPTAAPAAAPPAAAPPATSKAAPAPAPPGGAVFVNQSSGKCLGGDTQYNAFAHNCGYGTDQQWGLYVGAVTWVVNKATGMCLDSNNAGHVYVLPCADGRAYQKWRLVDLGGGLFSFVNQPTGWCLGADGGYPYTRACVSDSQMKWKRIALAG